ncbi:MAG TPA: glycosyltransferase, partial [Verrucomicrobiae bacterium]|nr:glycosyltransferase [Verrucomicrobiae bacterium]
MKALRIPKEKITAIWLSGEHILRCEGDDSFLSRNALTPGRYTLAVGSKNPNKNLRGVVEAAHHLPPGSGDFVVAGGVNRSIFVGRQDTASGVKELGFVNDDELRSLYENAACFVFPSFYEGFGLPPLEALSLGCPV